MIGGIDIQLPTWAGESSLEVAVRTITQHWPQAVFEDGISGDRYDDFWSIPFGMVKELFVYKACKFADDWDEKGAVPELTNTMVHLIPDDDILAVVIDEKDEEMNVLISAIESGLRDAIWLAQQQLEAA